MLQKQHDFVILLFLNVHAARDDIPARALLYRDLMLKVDYNPHLCPPGSPLNVTHDTARRQVCTFLFSIRDSLQYCTTVDLFKSS